VSTEVGDPAPSRAAAPMRHRTLAEHAWDDVVFVHWRHDAATLARLLPAGLRPDVVDGSAWVGLVAYVFDATRVPPFPPSRRLGAMTEVTIEVLTVDPAGRRGTTYLTVDTQNLPAVVAARTLLGVPYTPARAGSRREGETVRHRSVRPEGLLRRPLRGTRTGGPSPTRYAASVSAVAGEVATGTLTAELTTRAGIHARLVGRTVFWQRQHDPLTVRRADLTQLDGDLPDAVGLPGLFDRTPDSVLVVDGTTVRYAWGDVVR
jgi:uncharacterized protein YqjF (DUF2071 family)